MESSFLYEIEKKFNSIRTHPNFIVRERVYKGGLFGSAGLENQHNQFLSLKRKLKENPLPENYLKYNEDKLNKIVKGIVESLDIFETIVEAGYSKVELAKFIQVTKFELLELIKFIDEGYMFDETKLMSLQDQEELKRTELQEKIEDNFNQITSSFAWKAFEANEKNSVEGIERITNYREKIQATIENGSNVKNVDYLLLLSIIAMKIRSEVAYSPERLINYTEFFQTLSKIFMHPPDNPYIVAWENQQITAEDLKRDVERKINTGKLNWLVSLHNHVMEEYRDQLLESYTIKLYRLSRQPKDEFLWTMIQIAKEQSSSELEMVSIAYANIATCLLSMNYELQQTGHHKLAQMIQEVEEITALDAITDIEELYNSKDVNLDHMINALRKQLETMKNYAKKIIEIEELKEPFKQIIEFTDLDVKFSTEFSIENYLDSLGVNN